MATDPRHEPFLALLEAHQKILYKVAFVYCAQPDDRQDLVQEMIVQLWRSFPRYDPRYRFSTWMYRIAVNTAISFARSSRRRQQPLVSLDAELTAGLLVAPEPDELWELRQAIEGLDSFDDDPEAAGGTAGSLGAPDHLVVRLPPAALAAPADRRNARPAGARRLRAPRASLPGRQPAGRPRLRAARALAGASLSTASRARACPAASG